LAPEVLERVLSQTEALPNPRVLVGFDKADDGGVYLLNDDQALVQTIDFFTPVVDDPKIFGQIAAANALSDVYAMGGQPVVSLSVLCFPEGVVEEELLVEIVQGGTSKMNEAGVSVVGGHSVQDREMKFGYAVTGIVDPKRMITNAAAQPGDHLLLTKPLGIGIITTGIKFGKANPAAEKEAIRWMLRLNQLGSSLSGRNVRAATDITGYGLLGHAFEMAKASNVTLRLEAGRVPVIEGTEAMAAEKILPGGIMSNRRYLGEEVDWRETSDAMQSILLDPQTSGGLLISIPQEASRGLRKWLNEEGSGCWKVGEVVARSETAIQVV
jgi:selenide,water dikinase